MTTDLSNKSKSVEELRSLIGGCLLETHSGIQDNLAIALCSYFSSHLDRPETDPDTENGWGEWVEQKTNDALELIAKTVARRLEEAQQRLKRYTRRSESGESIGDYFDALDALEEAQQRNAAHDAKLVAEAKAKVREDLLNLLHEAVGFCGHCGKKTCAGRESNSILPGEIDLNVVLDAIAKAAEYRAEAGRKE